MVIEQRVEFKNSRGMKLAGLFTKPNIDNPLIVIILHGLNGNKTYYEFINRLAEDLPKEGFAVLRFDFNTHGESDSDWKSFTRVGCADDLDSAVNFLKTQEVDLNRIGIFATSMGATPFVIEAKKIKAAVLYNPFLLHSLWKDWIGEHEGEIKKRGYIQLVQRKTKRKLKYGLSLFNESINYDIAPEIKKVKCPTLILFGSKDSTSEKDRIDTYNEFNCIKDFKIIDDAGHYKTNLKQTNEIIRLSLDWFKKYL